MSRQPSLFSDAGPSGEPASADPPDRDRAAEASSREPIGRERILEAVRHTWGFDDLRPLQEEAIHAGLEGRDSLVVLPTGGGKSLCYQVPALLQGRTDVVVSPLISLMKDQVDGLVANGYPAVAIHSGMDRAERQEAERLLGAGEARLVFVAPERLVSRRFLALLAGAGVRHFAIDEAHCISHWGHDFRPEYRQLAVLKRKIPGASLHAFTATATERVREDIAAQLGMQDPEVLVGRFDRPNLVYRVVPRLQLRRQVLEVLERHPGDAGIVYCISRADTERLAEWLQEHGVDAVAYHAGLAPRVRSSTQEAFARAETDVVVATVAFGMGIDRSDVRCVIHAAMPKSIEHYQQESGRAGRDGLEAECVLLWSPADALRWERLLSRGVEEAGSGDDDAPEVPGAEEPAWLREAPPASSVEPGEAAEQAPGEGITEVDPWVLGVEGEADDPATGTADVTPERSPTSPPDPEVALEAALQLLRDMRRLCAPGRCRHRALSEYFGQSYEREDCEACDVCLGESEGLEDGTETARKVLSCVARVQEGYGVGHVVDVLRGGDTARIRELGHDGLSTHGILADRGRKELVNVVYQLVDQGLLERTEGRYPVLRLTPDSVEVLRGDRSVDLVPVRRRSVRSSGAERESWEGVDAGLFEHLRGLRTRLARQRNVPPYIIFSDATLRDMARRRPRTSSEMLQVHGVGDKKLADLGDAFLEAIAEAEEGGSPAASPDGP